MMLFYSTNRFLAEDEARDDNFYSEILCLEANEMHHFKIIDSFGDGVSFNPFILNRFL